MLWHISRFLGVIPRTIIADFVTNLYDGRVDMVPPRKEPVVKSHWLKCRVSPGQFSGEYVVEAKDFRESGFSLFVPDDVVECDAEPREGESVDGLVQVEILDSSDDLALIKLPRTPLENGPTVTVRVGQLAHRTAKALA
jgi:hypothetical protein